jgi:hypothetical protein
MISRGKFGEDSNMPSSEFIGDVGTILFGSGFKAWLDYIKETDRNLGEAAEKLIPDLDGVRNKIAKSLEISKIETGGFSSMRKAFDINSGFMTEGMAARGMVTDQPLLNEAQKQNMFLERIATTLETHGSTGATVDWLKGYGQALNSGRPVWSGGSSK